ncbi:MAG: DNA polymerase III subunit delta [Candidatus Marinimicrobia bacterium]|nr:DNA polymerase III subunit delta [Candidatus Neomarinimicrobiota bacterium]
MSSQQNKYQAYLRLLSDLDQGQIHPLYLARGADYYLYQQFMKRIKASFQKKFGQGAEIVQRWGSDLKTIADVTSLLGGGGLFATASLVLLHEIQDAGRAVKPALHQILGGLSSDTIVLAHYSSSDFRKGKWISNLESISTMVPLESPAAGELPVYVKQMAKKYELNINESAILRLIELSGAELAIIDNEMQKLALYLGEQKQMVERDLIDQVAGSVENAKVTQFVDAFSHRNRSLAVRTLVEINSRGKEGLPYAVSQLYNRLIQLMTLQEKLEVRKAIGKGIISYYFLKDLQGLSRNYTLEELQAATYELAEIDYQFRLGSNDMLAAFSSWVSRVV